MIVRSGWEEVYILVHGLGAIGVPAQRGGSAPAGTPVAANEVLTVWLMAMLGLGSGSGGFGTGGSEKNRFAKHMPL